MSVMQAYSDVGRAIQHARSLFSATPEPPDGAVSASQSLGSATTITADTNLRLAGLTGRGVDGHRSFSEGAARQLVGAAVDDLTLAKHMQQAALVTQQGAARLGVLAEQHQGMAPVVAAARTAPAQRAVLAALRSQAAQVSAIVDTTQQDAAGIAARLKTLSTKTSGLQAGPDDTVVGDDPNKPHIQMVDNVTGGPLPQEPPPPVPAVPPPPQTDEPIMLPPAPPRIPAGANIIDASPPDDPAPSGSGAGFPKADAIQQLKDFGEILAGGTLFAASIPADIATLGTVGTAGLIGGSYMVFDGVDNLRRAK